MPRRTSWVKLNMDDPGWDVSVTLAEVDGRQQIVGLRLQPADLEPGTLRQAVLNTANVQRIKVRRIKDSLRSARPRRTVPADVAWLDGLRLEPGKPYPDEFYEFVALMYHIALEAGIPPVLSLMEDFGASRSAVVKWIHTARQKRLLGWPERRGVAGTSESTPDRMLGDR